MNDTGPDGAAVSILLTEPVSQLPPDERDALADWLLAHKIDPHEVAPGTVIECDEYIGRIKWWSAGADNAVTMHLRYYPPAPAHGWLPATPAAAC